MKITKFINRDKELDMLEDAWRKDAAQFIVIYGRRRVGKTALIKEFIKNKKAIYFLGRLESRVDALKRLSRILAKTFADPLIEKQILQSWDAALEYIYQKSIGERLAVILDEFPYIVKTSPQILSVLQEFWDEKLKSSKIFLVICGSLLSMMEKYVFSYRMPIYGRRTLDLKLAPFKFTSLAEFFPNKDLEGLVQIYSVLGGTPAYLLEYEENIVNTIRKLLYGRSYLLREPEFILREELEEPRYFMSILRAIAAGRNSLGEVMNDTGLSRGIVGKYLNVLIDLDLIERRVPVTDPWKSRKGRYFIKDNYFNFWFHFIHPNWELIEIDPESLVEYINQNLDEYIGPIFEDICKELLIELNKETKLPLKFTKIGKWWYRDAEIDLLAFNRDKSKVLMVEVKWGEINSRDVNRIIEKLNDKGEKIPVNSARKY